MERKNTRTIETIPFSTSGDIVNSGSNPIHIMTGFHLAEINNPAGSAVVRLRNGGATGDIIVTVNLGAGESMEESYDLGNYYNFDEGLYVQIVSGTAIGTIRGRV